MSRLSLPILFALCLVTGSLAEGRKEAKAIVKDWPQWRGPNRDGCSPDTGLLKQWPTDGPTLLWKAAGLGAGFSSVSLCDGRIYTLGDRSDACFLIALDTNGKELWAAKVGEPKGGGGYPGPRATPTIDGDLIFALGQHGDLVCFETGTGKELWRKSYSKDFGGKKDENWGCSESPLVDGDHLICTPGGKQATMVALRKRTGEVVWKTAVPGGAGAGHSSPVAADVAGIRHYVQLTTKGVFGFAVKDGKLLWKYEKFTPNTANIPTCIVQGDEVFCSAGYEGKSGGGALLKIKPKGDGLEAEELYFAKELNNKHGGWVRVGEHLYGDRDDKGRPRCVEWKTGKEVWTKEGRGSGSGSAAIAYADGRLYVRYASGVMALLDASPTAYKEVSSFRIPRTETGPSWPHPVIIGGKLYVREQETLLCFDVKTR